MHLILLILLVIVLILHVAPIFLRALTNRIYHVLVPALRIVKYILKVTAVRKMTTVPKQTVTLYMATPLRLIMMLRRTLV